MEILLIRLAEGAGEVHQWALLDNAGEIQSIEKGSLEEAAQHTGGRRIFALAPPESILLTGVDIPSRNARQLLKAIPYALEDELAQDIDDLHFALGKRRDTHTPVAAVDHDCMQAWDDALRSAGIRAHGMISEVLALPYTPDHWSVMLDAERALVRTGEELGYACESEYLADLLAAELDGLEETERPAGIRIWAHEHEIPDTLLSLPVAAEVMSIEGPALTTLAHGFRPGVGVDLLQGPYSHREALSRTLRPWLAVAVLAGVVVLFGFTMRGIQYYELKSRSESLQSRIEQVYRDTFPDAQRVINPRVQMEQKLRELQGGPTRDESQFLPLVSRVGEELINSADLRVTSLSFRNGRLDLALDAKSPQALDALRQRLSEKTGLSAELQSVSTQGDSASGQLRISTGS